MDNKVVVYTRVYNTKQYLRQCIESVLNQTYSNFIYIIVDNGCTDGSSEIIKEYAAKDSRIRCVRFEKNGSVSTGEQIEKHAGSEGDYITILDSDDWWEPNYLERLLNLALDTKADIVLTGTFLHIVATGEIKERSAPQKLLFSREKYAEYFEYYHMFFRTVWAKLIRREIYFNSKILTPEERKNLKLSYGNDTLNAFAYLKNSKRVCIDSSILHHYRIHQKSSSYKYNPNQSFSDLYLFNDAVNFLSEYGSVSQQNMEFLYRIYANAIKDTAANLYNSSLSPTEKMHEYNKILVRQATKNAYTVKNPEIELSRQVLLSEVIMCADELTEENSELRGILSAHLPNCGGAVTVKSVHLFRLEKDLFDALMCDNKDRVAEVLLRLIVNKARTKEFDIPEILRGLANDNPLLCDIYDEDFLRKYPNLYLMILKDDNAAALDAMTDVLLNNAPPGETFLYVYLSLAASLDCVDEFIFGKIKTALFYLNEKRFDDCKETLDEISEMGVEDNEEIADIKAQLST